MNGERGTGNGEWGIGVWELVDSGNQALPLRVFYVPGQKQLNSLLLRKSHTQEKQTSHVLSSQRQCFNISLASQALNENASQ